MQTLPFTENVIVLKLYCAMFILSHDNFIIKDTIYYKLHVPRVLRTKSGTSETSVDMSPAASVSILWYGFIRTVWTHQLCTFLTCITVMKLTVSDTQNPTFYLTQFSSFILFKLHCTPKSSTGVGRNGSVLIPELICYKRTGYKFRFSEWSCVSLSGMPQNWVIPQN